MLEIRHRVLQGDGQLIRIVTRRWAMGPGAVAGVDRLGSSRWSEDPSPNLGDGQTGDRAAAPDHAGRPTGADALACDAVTPGDPHPSINSPDTVDERDRVTSRDSRAGRRRSGRPRRHGDLDARIDHFVGWDEGGLVDGRAVLGRPGLDREVHDLLIALRARSCGHPR